MLATAPRQPRARRLTARNLGWTVRWTFPGGQTITQLWSGTLTVSGSSVTVRNATYNGSVPANGTTSFGFTGTYSGSNTAPTDVTCTSP